MAQFPADARVAVTPFARRREGEYTTLGDPRRGVFVTVPTEGLELLDALASGKTVAEAVREYEQAHGETPDAEDFLSALEASGFVARCDGAVPDGQAAQPDAAAAAAISPQLARRLFGAPVVGACAAVAILGLALVAIEPGLMPAPTVLVFHEHLAALATGLVALNLLGVVVHELAHLLAARAGDVDARIGIGHRLWILVAETDMSGIWMAPKRHRYFAFLAGPLVDAALAGLFLVVLWAQRRGWIALSAPLAQFAAAALWVFVIRLLWQCFVFVRTDFYYVLATALDCKNLLADTEDLLRNKLARLRGPTAVVDQSAIPQRERRAIRAYAVVWLAGRAVALASLGLITLPVIKGYLSEVTRALSGRHSSLTVIDVVALACLGLSFQAAGFFLWTRTLYRGRTQRTME